MAELSWEVRVGDSRDLLRAMPDASVDAIVCDPPYELGFMGKAWDASGIAYSVPLWTEALRVLRPGGHLLAFGGSRTYHRMACAIEDAGFQIRDSLVWIYGSGFPKSLNVAKGGAGEAWSGWGTALKPAQEPIVMARKPLAGTIVETVLRYGTGAINVDGCRVASSDAIPVFRSSHVGRFIGRPADVTIARTGETRTNGRWPANVLLSHGDGCRMVGARTILRAAGPGWNGLGGDNARHVYGKGWTPDGVSRQSTARTETVEAWECAEGCPVEELGDFARYFYAAKPSTRERDAGLEHLPTRAGHEVCDGEEGSAGASNPRAGIREPRANVHPTVKPIELMRYLVRLVTPPGGLVLDPFAGSGTTGCAAVLEGARFLGLELSPEYAEIARARIAHWAPTQAELWPAAE